LQLTDAIFVSQLQLPLK